VDDAVGDHDAIRSLIAAYGERIDSGDLDGVAALFERATWCSSGRVLTGPAQVRRVYDDVLLYDGIPCTQHAMTNVVVTVDGDRATSRCSFTVLQAVDGFPLQPVLAGRYHDEFARTERGWEFRDRTIHADLRGDLSRHMRRR
jgi:Ring hydroxylating beta subunit.